MEKRIVVLAGDGIGPEITSAAVEVLKKTAVKAVYAPAWEPMEFHPERQGIAFPKVGGRVVRRRISMKHGIFYTAYARHLNR